MLPPSVLMRRVLLSKSQKVEKRTDRILLPMQIRLLAAVLFDITAVAPIAHGSVARKST